MSEIDVSKCDYYFQGRCGVSKNINYSIGCYANDCYYKQLQQLKQENEELKKKLKTIYDILDMCENGNCSDCKYEDCDDCTSLNHNDILQLIKQAKEG